MNVLRIVGGQGSGKSNVLGRLYRDGVNLPDTLLLTVKQNRLTDVGNMIDAASPKPSTLMLDIECELSPAAQQKLINVCESRGVQQLFLAYQG